MTRSVFTPCQKPQEGCECTSGSCSFTAHRSVACGWLSRFSGLFPPPLPHLSYLPLSGGGSQPTADLVCLSGMNGSTLWSCPLPEEAQDVTCLDLIPGSVAKTICLVTGTRKMLSAFNATSGKECAERCLCEPQCRI